MERLFLGRIEILKWAKDLLGQANVPDIDASAELILAHILGVSRGALRVVDILTPEQEAVYIELIARRCNREPLDKILGNTEFMGLSIRYSDNVLTPRQETEILADKIIAIINSAPSTNCRVLDICCGSGCIGLSIARNTGARVTLSDISELALLEVRANMEANNIGNDKIEIVRSDMFNNITGEYDIIVSNPPYLRTDEMLNLEPEVKDYDPSISLDGGVDGLEFYRIIADNCSQYLAIGGRMYLEIGMGQHEDVIKLLEPYFERVVAEKDYAGIYRFIIAENRR